MLDVEARTKQVTVGCITTPYAYALRFGWPTVVSADLPTFTLGFVGASFHSLLVPFQEGKRRRVLWDEAWLWCVCAIHGDSLGSFTDRLGSEGVILQGTCFGRERGDQRKLSWAVLADLLVSAPRRWFGCPSHLLLYRGISSKW